MTVHTSRLASILRQRSEQVLGDWMAGMVELRDGGGAIDKVELTEQARMFVRLMAQALAEDAGGDITGPAWLPLREMLTRMSTSHARQGLSPTDTAMFLFSFKRPLFALLSEVCKGDPDAFARELWAATSLLDRLGLYTTEVAQKGREEVILRQQRDLLELSTPVVALWEGVLAVPLIGTLDSERAQVVTESLLERIVETSASIAIIDITGVPTVDSLVAQHLLKTVSAARLMGAECIISGIRPQIAQTIVHLGVDLGPVVTKASLSAAFQLALARQGATIVRATPSD